MRGKAKKLLWALTCIVLLLLVIAALGLGYLYHNPSSIKDVVARTISGVSGVHVHISSIDWSTQPLRVRVEGIQADSPDDPKGRFQLSVRTLEADMSFEGDFGKRTLVIDRAGIRGAELMLEGPPVLPVTGAPKARRPSLAARIGAGLLSRLLFSEFRIEHAELEHGTVTATNGATTFWLNGIQASAVPEEGTIRASCEAGMEHPGSELLLDLPQIHMHADLKESEGILKGRLSIPAGVLDHPGGTLRGISLESSGEFHQDEGLMRIDAFVLRFPDLRPFLPVDLQSPLEMDLSASASILPRDHRLETEGLRITLASPPAQLDMETRINLSWAPILKGSLEEFKCLFRPAQWIPLLPVEYKKALAGIEVSGLFRVLGGLETSMDERGLYFAPDLTLSLENNPVSWSSPPLKAGSRISGELRFFGAWPDLNISTGIRAAALSVEHPSLHIPHSEATVQLSGRPAAIQLQEAELRAPEIQVTLPETPLLLKDVHIQAGKGLIHPFIPSGEILESRIKAQDLGPFLVDARIGDETRGVSLQGRQTGIIPFLSDEGRPFHGWHLKGEDSVHLYAETDGSGTWNFSTQLALKELSFENAEMDAFGEALHLTFEADGTAEGDGSVFLESSNLKASSGEILVDRFYLDMKSHPFSANARTLVEFDPPRLLDSSLDIVLGDLVSIKVSGDMEQAGDGFEADLALLLPPFRLEPAFQVFAVEPFAMKMPVLKNMSLNGEASADLRIRTNAGGFSVMGEARVREADVLAGDRDLGLENLSLSLPIQYGDIPDNHGALPLKGKLEVGNLGIPLLPDQPLSLDLDALPNRIRIPGYTRLMIPGGEIRIGPLNIGYHKDKNLRLESGLHMEDVDLGPLLEIFWEEAPEGGLVAGSLAPVIYERGTITSRGAIKADVFGGRVTAENIGASGLFTSAPVFGLDARWEGLNLEQMTSGTAFGRITGILDGRLEGFELAYGQPQRFHLLMETVQKKGVDQRISVKAVDNIAQIGGGGSPFVGMAGYFTSLFREFPYERIGVRAVLEADTFRINGTILEGDKEYIIKRSGFSGVNVVNRNPDNRIGFKDMVKRIQRVTASHGGPVIQ